MAHCFAFRYEYLQPETPLQIVENLLSILSQFFNDKNELYFAIFIIMCFCPANTNYHPGIA
jgi:hypothetical protein